MENNTRINLVILFFILLGVLFVVRVFKIQVLDHSKYTVMAKSQHFSSITISARRGTIYTSDNYPLAATETRYLLYAEPNNIEDSSAYAQVLAEILGKDKEKAVFLELSIKEKLSADLFWVALKKGLSYEEKSAIENLGLTGIGFEEEYTRFYPEGALASHILGFVGSDENGNPQGYFGLEGYYDGELKGVEGMVYQEKDAFGLPIAVGNYSKVTPKDGRSLKLSIDRAVQFVVESKLKEAVEKYLAKSGSIIIVDPRTGKIIAMANHPNFHPSNPYEKDEEQSEGIDYVRNLSVASIYEPGSVIKALTMSAGINMGKITPNTTYMDDGPKMFSGHIVDTWDGKHYGLETMVSILQHSNNLGAVWVGQQVGVDNLSNYFKKFGLGELAGIDLEGEDTGMIRDLDSWTDIDLAAASFGQGISATPLQVVMSFSAIANDGELMKPYIVTSVFDFSGKPVAKFKPVAVRRVISEESANTIIEMLTSAVSGGEAKFFVSKKYLVAGKTGTAQIPEKGTYNPNKTNATFVGFLPTSRKFVMLVKLEEPTTSIYASETAVPVWVDIAEWLAAYYGIPPDK